MIRRLKRQTKRRHSMRAWSSWRIDSRGEARLFARAVLADLDPNRSDIRTIVRGSFTDSPLHVTASKKEASP